MPDVVALPTFEGLCEFVACTLCQLDALDPQQTPVYRAPVQRAGKAWGVLFHADGPRRLRTSAVWADEKIVFYDSVGRRVRDVSLSESPDLPAA
jgi:hypothetical protein